MPELPLSRHCGDLLYTGTGGYLSHSSPVSGVALVSPYPREGESPILWGAK
jgi:hypothetical protein